MFNFQRQGPTGSAGPTGPTGPTGVNWRGAWSAATAYATRDAVVWGGASFVALAGVAAGGTPPAGDATNWLRIGGGGGEVNRVEATAQYQVTAQGTTDITGLTGLVVPAHSGPVELEAYVPAIQAAWTASATTANSTNVRLLLEDEAGNVLANPVWVPRSPGASGSLIVGGFSARRAVADNASAKTYKARLYVSGATNLASVTLFLGPGTINEAGIGVDTGPGFVVARGR